MEGTIQEKRTLRDVIAQARSTINEIESRLQGTPTVAGQRTDSPRPVPEGVINQSIDDIIELDKTSRNILRLIQNM